MRPLELTLEGFRSYRSETTFDFQDRGVFGIVGPTGAGKSSILDGIIYALYGRTPQIGKDTKKLIASGMVTARIRLTFEVAGTIWDVTRVLRSQGASQVVLREPGANAEASGERAVNERIIELIGLDYDAFCSSVTLPQGEFDRFLKATPSERSKVLKRIFRYERVDAMREAAKGRLNEIDVVLQAAQAELAALDPGLVDRVAELEAARAEREARAALLRAGAAEFGAAQAVVAGARSHLDEVDRQLALLAATLAKVPAEATIQALAVEESRELARLQAAEAAATQAADDAAGLEAGADALERRLGGERLAAARRAAARRQDNLRGATARQAALAEHAGVLAAARGSLERQQAATDAADEAVIDADRALQGARQAHAALFLRTGLRPGEACPVCAQTIAAVPESGAAPLLEAAEAAARRAAQEQRTAASQLTALHKQVASTEARAEAAAAATANGDAELATLDRDLAALLGEGVDALAEIARREAAIASARREEVAARRAAQAAAGSLAAERRALEGVHRTRRGVAGDLIAVCAALGLVVPSTEDDAASLAGAARRAREAGVTAVGNQERLRAEVLTQEAASQGILGRLRADLQLSPGEDISDAIRVADQAVGALGEQLAQVREAIRRRGELEGSVAAQQQRRALYQRLWSDLTDAKFTAYLLDAHRHALARVGSEQLFALTGRYRFDDEGQFNVLNVSSGDVARSPDTLSGGETFLASLALALALADAVSQGGGHLACFFLDEGFGSLDAASLDLALDGVESLALPGRLIGVISHVGGVQARMDDLIVLDKAADGSTIVVQTDGPIAYASGSI